MTAVDVDKLPPTQQLILEILTARARLGEPSWPFADRLGPAIAALKRLGLVENLGSVVNGHTRVEFTDAGRDRMLGSGYVSPIEKVRARATRAEDRYGALLLGATQAWAELLRREREHAGHGRDGHLDEDDLNLLRDVVFGQG